MQIDDDEQASRSTGGGGGNDAGVRDHPELLEPFLALMPDAAVVVDGDGMLVALNQQAASLFGYPVGELAGKPVETLVPERFRHGHRAHRAVYMGQPRSRPMGAGLELSGRRSDGSEFPLDISLAPLGGPDGTLVVAAIRDATERRAVAAASAQLATIVRSSADAIVSMTAEGGITSWNPGAARLFGYSAEEAVGCHISILVPDEASPALEELMGKAISGEPATSRDTVWRRRDGTIVDVALTVSTLSDAGGRPVGFSAIIRDVTQRKRAEVETRRLLVELRRRERQQAATAEIRLAMLSDASTEEVVGLICERAVDLVDLSAAGCLVGPPGRMRVVAATGQHAERMT
ncbi:MAG TPA: PAS domain S-box protein, partial [Acidimicrobiales bacterium]|nr:PAS domain S-box protein [Acidimicrobiales bacterium]